MTTTLTTNALAHSASPARRVNRQVNVLDVLARERNDNLPDMDRLGHQ